MKKTLALLLALIVGVSLFGHNILAQNSDEILPGCKIPKSFGRAITVTNPPSNGLAGQMVFEDAEGTIRWVVMVFSATEVSMPKGQSKPGVRFPALPFYECALGQVWTRY